MKDIEIISELAVQLSVALEMTYQPVEIATIWEEAVEALREARERMRAEGIVYESVVDNIIRVADEA